MRINQVNLFRLRRPEIDFNRLPRTGSVLDGNLNPDGVGLFHVPTPGFKSKYELIETQTQDIRQRLHPARAAALNPQIEVLRCTGMLREA
jgi:hypothetical protein